METDVLIMEVYSFQVSLLERVSSIDDYGGVLISEVQASMELSWGLKMCPY